MLESSISFKGQITIPKQIRNSLKLKPGDRVTFVADGDKAILMPIRGDIFSLKGLLKPFARKKSLKLHDMRMLAKQQAVSRYHQHRQGPTA